MYDFGRLIWVGTAAILLAACSNNDSDDDAPAAPPATTPERGSLIQSPPERVISISAEDLTAIVNSAASGAQALQIVGAPKCGIDVHRLQYNTVDPTGQPTTSSGALMIPTGSDAECQGPRPIVLYAHGTTVERTFDIANISASDNAEGLSIAVVFAARGYIVVAPNYAGYATSTLPYHPYLHADQQSKDTADALTAARSALPTSTAPNVSDSGKLFVTGYSQGGHVAIATHRLMQSSGTTVTASAPMSGPYALAAFADAVFYGQVVRSAPVFATLLATAYDKAYGDIYAAPTEMFEARYADGIDTLLPFDGNRSDLFAQGKLPREQLFSSMPPDPSFAPYTPATEPAEFAPLFARGFGPENLITNAYRLSYLQDAQLQPDGGFPSATDLLPAANPTHPLRKAFKANDLRNWLPTSPVLLCAGNDDPTVLYMNTDLMQRYWSANGVPVKVLDVDSPIALDDPDAALKAGFAVAKQSIAADAVVNGATDGGAAAVMDVYHSTLVPPFCLAAVKAFFDGR